MFPQDTIDIQIAELSKQETTETAVKRNFVFDYTEKKFKLIDGKIVENLDVEATKQWIILFLKTSLEGYPVYEGSKFGTNVKKLLGYKILNNGFLESEVERNIKEGFLLCPNIERVLSFNMTKEGTKLNILVTVLLYGGEKLEVSTFVANL